MVFEKEELFREGLFIMADNFGDGLKDIFLAGVGALALTGEKTQEVVDKLIAKGELTVEQGKEINQELAHKASATVSKFREETLSDFFSSLSPEEKKEFADQVAKLASEQEEAPEKAEDAKEADKE